jgi:hypothetical protein
MNQAAREKAQQQQHEEEQQQRATGLQRGTFSTATITKRSHSGRPSYPASAAVPPVINARNLNEFVADHQQRHDSISSSDLSSNASNYESPYTSSINIHGRVFFIFCFNSISFSPLKPNYLSQIVIVTIFLMKMIKIFTGTRTF